MIKTKVKWQKYNQIFNSHLAKFVSTHEFGATVENEPNTKCIFCGRWHASELYQAFDVEKRKNILKNQMLPLLSS